MPPTRASARYPPQAAQAQAQAQALKHIALTKVASSDLVRARFGARQVIEAQATPPPWQQTPDLREMNMGDAEGMGYAEAREAFPILEGKGYG
ncbi:MAG: histidine phosphatase family protein, partial [Nannocystaceae bacterium]